MNTHFKNALIVAVVTGLSAAATAMAGDSYLNAGSKARGEFGNTARRTTEFRPIYRAPAPVIVQREAPPSAVAQAPSEQRVFSYEPSKPSEKSAQGRTRTYRSYSYEPSMRSYSGSRGRSSQPAYALPKTDPRKF